MIDFRSCPRPPHVGELQSEEIRIASEEPGGLSVERNLMLTLFHMASSKMPYHIG